jgi:hypothetical protein
MSPIPVTVLVAARHAAPASYTPRDKQTRFFERNKDKRKTKQNYPGFKFKPRQVNDSSQTNQETNHLVSQIHHRWLNGGPVGRTSSERVKGLATPEANLFNNMV